MVESNPKSVVSVVKALLAQPPFSLSPSAELSDNYEVLGMDSLAVVELILRIEDATGITLPDDETAATTCPADLIALVLARV